MITVFRKIKPSIPKGMPIRQKFIFVNNILIEILDSVIKEIKLVLRAGSLLGSRSLSEARQGIKGCGEEQRE
ncbi:MAG: hypothetical protein Roseis2KO_41860 [Roseivirga sp.]